MALAEARGRSRCSSREKQIGSSAGRALRTVDPELLIPQFCNLPFSFLFCFKLKCPLMPLEGYPGSPNSFQGKRLKTWMVLFVLQHRSLLLHVPLPLLAIPSRCKATGTLGTFPSSCVTSLQHCCCHPALGITWGTMERCMEVILEPDSARDQTHCAWLGHDQQ